MSNKTILTGNNSFDTAYFVEDYPYGFKLRCHMKYWIESKASQGQRFVSCTTDPRQDNTKWNKPKANTYSSVIIMYINHDNNDYICHAHLSDYSTNEEIDQFVAEYGEYFDEFQKAQVKKIKILRSAASKLKFTYKIHDGISPVQSKEEQSKLFNAAVIQAVKEYKE